MKKKGSCCWGISFFLCVFSSVAVNAVGNNPKKGAKSGNLNALFLHKSINFLVNEMKWDMATYDGLLSFFSVYANPLFLMEPHALPIFFPFLHYNYNFCILSLINVYTDVVGKKDVNGTFCFLLCIDWMKGYYLNYRCLESLLLLNYYLIYLYKSNLKVYKCYIFSEFLEKETKVSIWGANLGTKKCLSGKISKVGQSKI